MLTTTSERSGRHAVPLHEPAEPEVPERARRRVFSAQYKLRIIAEYERRERDGRSALLRREGLYTSSISEWRRQREEGALHGLGGTRGLFERARVCIAPSAPIAGRFVAPPTIVVHHDLSATSPLSIRPPAGPRSCVVEGSVEG